MSATTPGYAYDSDAVARSPVSLEELELLKATVLFGDDDVAALRQSGEVLGPRYVLTVLYSVVATLKPFLARKGHSDEDVERMHQTCLRSVLLQVTLWSRAYVEDGDF